MILSIGMIVKNEERTLRMCLNSIRPLLEQVESELIIADTGSSDSTIAIAREFTDCVFEIEWSDDFALARNTTLTKAKGEWYMYLDADEVFEDVSDIIRFFNSGEYKSYESARHIRRESKGVLWGERERLFKKKDNTKFIYKIHEQILADHPQKKLDSVAIHFDARYLSKKESDRKYEQYISILLKAYEDDPSNEHIMFNIVRESLMQGKYNNARKFIDIGLKSFNKDSLEPMYHYLEAMSIICYNYEEQYQKAVETSKDYFKTTQILTAWAVGLRSFEGRSLLMLDRPDEADEAFREALVLWNKNKHGELDHMSLPRLSALEVNDNTKSYLVNQILKRSLSLGNFDEAINISDTYGEKIGDAAVECFTSELGNGKYSGARLFCKYAADKFGTDSGKYNRFILLIEDSIKSSEIKLRLAEELTGEAVRGDYIRLQKLRKGNFDELGYFINSDKSFPDIYGDVIVAAMKEKIDFSGFVDRMDINGEMRFILRVAATNENICDLLASFLKENLWYNNCASKKTVRILYMLCEACIFSEKGSQNRLHVFEAYVRIYGRYLAYIYKEDVYTDSALDTLHERCGFIYYADKAYACKDRGSMEGFALNMRKALQRDKSMNDFVTAIAEELQENPPESLEDQLKREAVKVKGIIEGLIQSGNIEQAKQTLVGYEQIMPLDPDIDVLKKRISAGQVSISLK